MFYKANQCRQPARQVGKAPIKVRLWKAPVYVCSPLRLNPLLSPDI